MPIYSVPYVARPYASADGRIGDLLRRRGDTAAQALLRGGEIQAQMWSRLGQIGQNAVNDYVTERREAPMRADAARLRSLQLQEAERKAEEPKKLAAQDQAFMRLLSEAPDGDPDPRAVIGIYGPQRGMDIAKGLYEFSALRKGKVESPQDSAKRIGAAFKALKTPALQQAFWPQVKQAAVTAGLVTADQFPDTFSAEIPDALLAWGSGQAPAAKAPMALDPTKDYADPDTLQVVRPGTPAPKPPDSRSLEVQLAEAFRNGDTQAAEAIQRAMRAGRVPEKPAKPSYEWAFDPKTGKNVYVTPDEIRAGGFQKPTGSQRPASGMEKRAMGFFNRARQADVDLEGLEPEIQKMGLGDQAYMAMAPNFMQTETGQRYTQAQRAFTEARLRKDSGAAIPEQEFANDRRTYFAQPGDSKETLEQKRRARAAVLASLGTEAGQALAEFEGDGEAATALVEGYKTRSSKPAGGVPAEGTRGVVNGQPAVWKTVNGKAGWYAAN